MDKRKEVCRWSFVPDPLLEEIYQKHSNEDQRLHEECVDFYIKCHSDPSWRDVCRVLYNMNEMTAARKAKTFVPQTGE